MTPNNKLTILISARKNSKFLVKLLSSILFKAKSMENIEVLVMMNEHDTWNKYVPNLFPLFKFFREDFKFGRAGLHKYFEALLPHATGNWVLYLCDDQDVIMEEFDKYIFDFISFHALDSKKIYQIIPKFINTGSVVHILSRGWIETTKKIGSHGNVDSFLNDVANKIPEHRLLYPEKPIFIDYTCEPHIMTSEHCKTEIDPTFIARNYTQDQTVLEDISAEVQLIIEAIGKGK